MLLNVDTTKTSVIEELLGSEAESLLQHECKTIDKKMLHLPGGDVVNRIYCESDRKPQVLRSLQQLFGTGRLANTGYLSILPIDQGIEHSAGGIGLICGRKAFQRPMEEGARLIHAIQDVYLNHDITIA